MEAPDLSLTRPVLRNEAEKKLWETIVLQQCGGVVVDASRSVHADGSRVSPSEALQILAVVAELSAKMADRIVELRRGRVDDESVVKTKPIQLV